MAKQTTETGQDPTKHPQKWIAVPIPACQQYWNQKPAAELPCGRSAVTHSVWLTHSKQDSPRIHQLCIKVATVEAVKSTRPASVHYFSYCNCQWKWRTGFGIYKLAAGSEQNNPLEGGNAARAQPGKRCSLQWSVLDSKVKREVISAKNSLSHGRWVEIKFVRQQEHGKAGSTILCDFVTRAQAAMQGIEMQNDN